MVQQLTVNIEIILKKIEPYVEDFKIDVNEPSVEDSIKILEGIQKLYADFHKVKFEEDCAKEAVNLSKKYLLNSKLPDKAIDLLDETAASVKINEKKNQN